MAAWSLTAWTAVAGATFAVSAAGTRIGIGYAHRHRLLDLPGQRRSHGVATARGGGVGIVAAVLFQAAVAAASAQFPDRALALALFVAVSIVAAAGWIDDHRGLRAGIRFAAHCLAAGVLLAVPAWTADLAANPPMRGATVLYALAALAPGLAIVWSINLHNFMDGIDGLLTLQALFVLTSLAVLGLRAGLPAEAGVIALFAVAAAGFLPFNFPRARVFMGDVGSGVLGLLVAIAVGMQMLSPAIALASGIVLCSAFVTDATCTLLSRLLRGRRWYSAHREHLYQWLARSGFSHAQVVALYMGWNLLVVLPVVCWMNRAPAGHRPTGVIAAAAVYVLAVAVWYSGKRWCLAKAGTRGRHAAA